MAAASYTTCTMMHSRRKQSSIFRQLSIIDGGFIQWRKAMEEDAMREVRPKPTNPVDPPLDRYIWEKWDLYDLPTTVSLATCDVVPALFSATIFTSPSSATAQLSMNNVDVTSCAFSTVSTTTFSCVTSSASFRNLQPSCLIVTVDLWRSPAWARTERSARL